MGTSQRDLGADAAAALAGWREAVDGLRDNPLWRLLSRSGPRPLSGPERLRQALPWAVLLGLLIAATRYLLQRLAVDPAYLTALTLAIGLIGTCLLWCGSGLYAAAIHTLTLLGRPGALGRQQLGFDEALLIARLSDREIVVPLLTDALRRIWLRWFLGGCLLLGMWWIASLDSVEDAPAAQPLAITAYTAKFDAGRMLRQVPPTLLVLWTTGILAGSILVLWLMALGRNGSVLWQLQGIAASQAACQLAWLPLSLWQLQRWLSPSGTGLGDEALWPALSAPLAVLAVLTFTLHMTRTRPGLRLLAAALLPPLGLAMLWAVSAYLHSDAGWLMVTGLEGYWFGELVWGFSSLGMVNGLALNWPQALGYPDMFAGVIQSFVPWRLPVLLLIQLACLSLCAHAARVAVQDWRRAVD